MLQKISKCKGFFMFLACISINLCWANPGKSALKAEELPTGITLGDRIEQVQELKLSNGLQVLLIENDEKPETYINLVYRVGSRQEIKNANKNEHGLAHILEHLLIKRTPSLSNLKSTLDANNIKFNATTSQDRTNYFGNFAYEDPTGPERTKLVLTWLAENMRNANFTAADLATEMTVVRNEFERNDASPQLGLYSLLLGMTFPDEGYDHLPIGKREDIEQVKYEQVRAFYDVHYRPDNATLVIAGKFHRSQVIKHLSELFLPIATPKEALPTLSAKYQLPSKPRFTVRAMPTAGLQISAHAPEANSKENLALTVLLFCLFNPADGPAHERWVKSGLLASLAGNGGQQLNMTHYNIVATLPTSIQSSADQIATLAKVQNELKQLADLAPSIKDSSLTVFKNASLNFLENVPLQNTQFATLISEYASQGDWRYFWLRKEWLKSLSLKEVQATARYLQSNNTITVWHYPKAKVSDANLPPIALDLTPKNEFTQVKLSSIMAEEKELLARLVKQEVQDKTSNFPVYQGSYDNMAKYMKQGKLNNGMHWAVMPKATPGNRIHGLLRLRFGNEETLSTGTHTWRHAELFMQLLLSSNRHLSKVEMIKAISDIDLQLKADFANATSMGFSFTMPQKHTAQGLALIDKLIRDAQFETSDWQQVKQSRLNRLREEVNNPSARANNAIIAHEKQSQRQVVSKDSPRYRRTRAELRDDLNKAEVSNLAAFYANVVGLAANAADTKNSSAEIVLVGEISHLDAQNHLENIFGTWSNTKVKYERIKYPYEVLPAKTIKITTASKNNGVYLSKHRIPVNRDHEDFHALLLANQVLGGGAGARLWEKLREEKGYTYETSSSFNSDISEDNNSSLQINIHFAPENRAKVEAELAALLDTFVQDGITEAELAKAKSAQLEGHANYVTTEHGLAQMMAMQLQRNMGVAQQFAFREKLTAVTLQQVNAVIKKYFALRNFTQVWAGKFNDVSSEAKDD